MCTGTKGVFCWLFEERVNAVDVVAFDFAIFYFITVNYSDDLFESAKLNLSQNNRDTTTLHMKTNGVKRASYNVQ